MCGICGIIDTKNRLVSSRREKFVRQMNEAIVHRGPDEEGYLSERYYTLAMRRLSIIDLHGGTQPIFNEDRSIGVFFNGEIYNFEDLRKGLIAKGHKFETSSDTETIVHLYEEYGLELSKHLKGMFTFCLFDRNTDTFLLSRDRFGEKPLFYHFKEGVFSFSSEPLSLLQNKEIKRIISKEGLKYYLKASIVPEPLTMIKGVLALEPGHHLILRNNEIKIEPYFKINYQIDNSIKTEEQAVSFIRPYLKEAIKRQMVSDVPIGAFLSGGIDSSTIVANMQMQASQAIKTFTVKFEHAPYDESHIAREVANRLGTDHHEIIIPNQNFDESLFWNIIDHVGLPFNDSSCIPSYLITKEIRKHVTVALSGDGGDELFAGYPVFQWWTKIHQLKRFPNVIRKLALATTKGASKLPIGGSAASFRQIQKAIAFSMEDSANIPLRIHEMFAPSDLQTLLKQPDVFLGDYPRYTSFWKESKGWSPLRQIMFYRLKYNLTSNMLVKVDRMSMANSLEVRAPFLDPDLFEASTKIPDRFLIKGNEGKYLIRQVMKDVLPDSVFNHPKTGFAIPLHKYQNENYRHLANELFDTRNPLTEWISIDKVKEIMEVGLNTHKNNAELSVYRASHRLWAMMLLFAWVKRFNIQID